MKTHLLPIALLLACQPANPAAERVDRSVRMTAPVIAAGDSIVLERGRCYGTCPQYRVTVSRSGAVKYTGVANVTRLGNATSTIAPSAAAELLSHVGNNGVFEIPDSIVTGNPACGAAAEDLPRVTMVLGLGGRTKRIVHDYGCSGAPRSLRQWHARIDSVSGSVKWTGTP